MRNSNKIRQTSKIVDDHKQQLLSRWKIASLNNLDVTVQRYDVTDVTYVFGTIKGKQSCFECVSVCDTKNFFF